MQDDTKEKVFSIIQNFLKNPPVIIWGSGATIPYGLPSMFDLNNALKEKIENFNSTNENLEIELGKPIYEQQLPKIKDVIWKTINNAEVHVVNQLISSNMKNLESVKDLIEKFRSTHPKVVNIITTNYDRILEYVMGYYGINFSDGFTGREFSSFDIINFKEKKIVNLIKVHGSLSWFSIKDNSRYLIKKRKSCSPSIIAPGKNKYRETYQEPYRGLIQKSDSLIGKASSFLIIGFGFNDEHLTPKIREKVNSGTPLVLITKEVTDSCKKELKDAQKYVFLEEKEGKTFISMKINKETSIEKLTIEDNYWQLYKFMEVL